MKRWLILVSLFIMTGCVDVEIKTRLEPDGSGVQIWNLTSSALVASEIKKQIEADPFLKKGKRILDQYKDGEYLTALEIPFKNAAELRDEGRSISFEKKGWLRQTCIYTEKWDEKKGRIPAIMKGAGGIVPLNIVISIEMPGNITRTNAPQMVDRIATWTFSIAEFPSSRTLIVESVHWNVLAILALAIGAAGIMGASVFLLLRRMRMQGSFSQTCSACGKIVPAGSYCNNCGAKLGNS